MWITLAFSLSKGACPGKIQTKESSISLARPIFSLHVLHLCTASPSHDQSFELREKSSTGLNWRVLEDWYTVGFQDITDRVLHQNFNFATPTTSFLDESSLVIQSRKSINGIPDFVVRVHKDLNFEAFHQGVRLSIPSLSKNRVTQIKSWSALEEILRYTSSCEGDHKKIVIQQHLYSMSKRFGEKVYSPEMIIRAFE